MVIQTFLPEVTSTFCKKAALESRYPDFDSDGISIIAKLLY